MRRAASLALAIAAAAPAFSAEISSEYTELDARRDCAVVLTGGEGDEGDWGVSVCPGWRGYPVLSGFAFGRLFANYGFPAGEIETLIKDSFGPPHGVSPKIEWRIRTEGEITRPFAVIRRWTIAAFDGAAEMQVLAVSRVGQPNGSAGCLTGYVMASGNPQANEQARVMADTQAEAFDCASGTPMVLPKGVGLPIYRQN